LVAEDLTAGEELEFGDFVYINSDSKMWKADASDSTSVAMPVFAMAAESISADSTGCFLIEGFARDDSWNWTVGGKDGIIWGSTVAGAGTQTPPTGAGQVVQTIGVAKSATTIYVRADLAFGVVD
jgi:hypothetical protein